MRSDHTIDVALPVEEAWRRCAEYGTYAGELDGVAFTATFAERDAIDRRLVLTGRTRDGAARATITACLRPDGGRTRVDVRLDLTGAAAPEHLAADLVTHLMSPPEATHAPAPGGAPGQPAPPGDPGPAPGRIADPAAPLPGRLRRMAGPAALAVAAGVAGYLIGRLRGAATTAARPAAR